MMIPRFVAALGAATVLFAGATTAYAQTTGTKPAPAGVKSAGADRMAAAKASLKSRFGFSDDQVNRAVQKVEAITKSYQPKIVALQKKAAAATTPEQKKQAQMNAIPLIMEITQKTNAALLAVATPAQRPKLQAQFKAEGKMFAQMQKGGANAKP